MDVLIGGCPLKMVAIKEHHIDNEIVLFGSEGSILKVPIFRFVTTCITL